MPQFTVNSIGKAQIPSPLQLPVKKAFVNESDLLAFDPVLHSVVNTDGSIIPPSKEGFEFAGPRKLIYFTPPQTKAAIVTCGGLCPGINAVIRGLVLQLWHRYGVRNIVGVRYGYQGLARQPSDPFMTLTPDLVESAHEQGGTILGSSRGTPPAAEIVDSLQRDNISVLFTIGGDGTMRGALEITEEIARRGLAISVVGLPKTIDNDIPFVKRSFGFETAVAIASQAIHSAYIEAIGARRGIGLVKLMGRHSGYIAATATLASGHPNICLIPEIPCRLDGSGGLLQWLEKLLNERGHAVVVVAEGAGQDFFKDKPVDRDLSGNIKLGDIGGYLRDKILSHFHGKGERVPLRYIDPSYIIRAAHPNPADTLFCTRLAQNAVHAAMAGKTALLVGYWHGVMTHVPLKALVNQTSTINPKGELWFNVLETTGQPEQFQ